MDKYTIMKRIIWGMTIIWMVTIFYFSNQSASISRIQSGDILAKINIIEESQAGITGDYYIGKVQRIIRKSAHFIEYCGLGILMTVSILFYRCKMNIRKRYLLSWVICTLYAASDEIHQMFIPGRGAMLRDVVLDSVASFIGVLIIGSLFIVFRNRLGFVKERSFI